MAARAVKGGTVSALHHRRGCRMASPSIFQSPGHFSQRATRGGGFHAQLQQVVGVVSLTGTGIGQSRAGFESLQTFLNRRVVTLFFEFFQLRHLLFPDAGIVNLQNVNGVLAFTVLAGRVRLQLILVDPHNDFLSGINAGLFLRGGFFNAQLGAAGRNVFGHATVLPHFLDDFQSLRFEFIGEGFHHVTSTPRIGHISHARFVLQD
mmetsp:Transcript_1472/g.3220  ORF Transcript_1472/g.3220 Transcript_1472/m.3220 type:complete len:206 (+) Transcript_1472:370-987(+)